MQITTKDNHVHITADEGNYVGLKDCSVFGEALSLGTNVSIDDVIEEPISSWPASSEELNIDDNNIIDKNIII